MKLHEKAGTSRMLTSEDVLSRHPLATRSWFIDSRKRSKRALKMSPKQVMDLCDWFEQDGSLFCRSKKTGRTLLWDKSMATWTDTP